MKDDFFEFIDSKEKAYWLGFIYAEGYIETRDQKPYRLGIEISKDDEILIDRFIEALDIDPNRKYYREKYHTVIVKFVNKTIVKDLVNLGVVPRKSKIIELPNLSKLELYLAFLLGFYDGDGKTGTTRIITGSKIFLEQIKKLFNLPFKIYEKRSQGYLGTRLIKSHGYSMSLGVVLYNKMLENYHYSLQRKRHEFKTEESRITKIKEVKVERIPPDSVIEYIDDKPELIDLWLPKVQEYFSEYEKMEEEELKKDSLRLFQIMADSKKYNILSELRNGLISRDELPKLVTKRSLDSLIENIEYLKEYDIIEGLNYKNKRYVVLKTDLRITTAFPEWMRKLLPKE